MKKNLLVLVIAMLLIVMATGVSAYVPASTNDDNRDNGWAHVNEVDVDIGEVTLDFISTRTFDSCFEYRTDGDTSQVIDEEHQLEFHNVVPESEGLQQYPYFCVNNNNQVETLTANEYVEIRMIFGAEGDERFDWTRFDVLPIPIDDEVDVMWIYSAIKDKIFVRGYAPIGAVSASLGFEAIGGTSPAISYPYCTSVDQDANPEFDTIVRPTHDTWEHESYSLNVVFFNKTGCKGTKIYPQAYGGEFNYLELLAIHEELAEMLSLIEDVNSSLYAEVEALWLADIEQDVDIAALQAEVEALWARVIAMNHGTISLEYFDENSGWLPNHLRVWGEAPIGADEAHVIIRRTDKTEYTSMWVDVETNQDNENAYDARFDVSQWDPLKYNVHVQFYENDERMTGYDVADTFDNLFIIWLEERITANEEWLAEVNANLTAHAEALSAIDLNLSLVWTEIGIIKVSLADLVAVDNAQQVQIDDLLSRVGTLEEKVTELFGRVLDLEILTANIADWGTFHDQSELTLTGNGIPLKAGWMILTVTRVDAGDAPGLFGLLNYIVEREVVELSGDGTFEITFDTSDWPKAGLNIHAQFYGDRNLVCTFHILGWCLNYDYVYEDFVGSAYNAWYGMTVPEFGFSEYMESRSIEVWNPQEEFSRVFNFEFTAPFTGGYRFSLVTEDPSGVIDKTFPGGFFGCRGLSETQTVNIVNTLEFPANEGTYTVHLEAEPCGTILGLGGGETDPSNRFVIEVIDLALPLPNNTAGISDLGILKSPITDIYYTNSTYETFDVLMQSDFGWSDAIDCVVYTSDGFGMGGFNNMGKWPMSTPNELNVTDCSGILDVAAITATNQDGPWTLEVCGEPKEHNPGNDDQLCDTLDIMYDNEAPVIDEESLNPGTPDIVSGWWNFSANVTDNGEIATVEFTLINKTNESDECYVGSAVQTEENFWLTQYDTAGECTNDGYYNFRVIATDYAGNSATLTIDPLIDNTPPVIGHPKVDGYAPDGFFVQATLEDNFAGVVSANATIVWFTCDDNLTVVCKNDYVCVNRTNGTYTENINLSRESGTVWDGVWTSETFSGDVGKFYEATVTAVDKAGNIAVAVTMASHYGRPGYTVTIATGKSTYLSNEAVDVSGTITSSDGNENKTDTILLGPGDVVIPILWVTNTYGPDNVGPLGTGQQTITATYTPNPLCDESFNASTEVGVEAAPSGGRGGGGGGTWHPLEEKEVPEEEPEEEQTNVENEPVETKDDSGEGEEGTGEEPQKEEKPVEPNNLVTGAVTGEGFLANAWPWLLALLGLIIVLFGASRLFKKN